MSARLDRSLFSILCVGCSEAECSSIALQFRNWVAKTLAGSFGFDHCNVPTGLAALHALRKKSFDLVILCPELPSPDGLMLVEQMALLKCSAPVLMIIEQYDPQVTIAAGRLGIHTLTKEKAESDLLLPAIRNVLMDFHGRHESSLLWSPWRGFRTFQKRRSVIRHLDTALSVAVRGSVTQNQLKI